MTGPPALHARIENGCWPVADRQELVGCDGLEVMTQPDGSTKNEATRGDPEGEAEPDAAGQKAHDGTTHRPAPLKSHEIEGHSPRFHP